MREIKLIQGDCLEVMKEIPDKSVDMILCDLPYGTTQCQWDTPIDLKLLWKQYTRIIKEDGAIVLTASQPFTSHLVMSNPSMFKYQWIWKKQKATRWLDCKKRPLQEHEDILIFYKKQPTYNPQMIKGKPYDKGFRRSNADKSQAEIYGVFKGARIVNKSGERYPRTVLEFNTAEADGKFHPTQKPVALMEYLIKTYSNEGDVILDNTMGSGSTGVACINLNRRFIGIELDEKYFEIAERRLSDFSQNHSQHTVRRENLVTPVNEVVPHTVEGTYPQKCDVDTNIRKSDLSRNDDHDLITEEEQ